MEYKTVDFEIDGIPREAIVDKIPYEISKVSRIRNKKESFVVVVYKNKE